MQPFTSTILIIAGLALFAGVQFAAMGWVKRRDPLFLYFGLTCLALAANASSVAFLYRAPDPGTVVQLVKLAGATAMLMAPCLILFILTYLNVKLPSRGWVITGWSVIAVLIAMNLIAETGIIYRGVEDVQRTELVWGETVTTFTGEPGLWVYLVAIFTATFYPWVLWRSVRLYRSGERFRGTMLGTFALAKTLFLGYGVLIIFLGLRSAFLETIANLLLIALMSTALARELERKDSALRSAQLELGGEVSRRQAAEQQISHMAYHDELTGLPNRALLYEHLDWAIAASRAGGTRGALILMDLDHFKTINDGLGHETGDAVLVAIAAALRERLPEESVLARVGGDEFVAVLVGLAPDTSEAELAGVTDGLRSALNHPLQIGAQNLTVGASIGTTVFPESEDSRVEIMRRADMALYAAKARGRGDVSAWSPGLQHEAEERLRIEAGLRAALLEGGLSLVFQPLVGSSDEVIGAEALMRWELEGRPVSPDRFIPIAEETGLIHDMGTWALEEACQALERWRDASGGFGGYLSVNVSPWQFVRGDFVESVARVIDDHTQVVDRLVLEITESAVLFDETEAVTKLGQLRELGVRFAIDDFGTGYSSLSQLRRLPMDILKIDRSFVSGLSGAEGDPLVRALIDVGANMGMDVVAEGVETGEQREALRGMGCECFQGYLISRPLDESGFLRWIAGDQPTH